MAIQMTRAEYEKKYGIAPATSKVDTAPAIQKMTRAEYEIKYYGAPIQTESTTTKVGTLNIDKSVNPFSVSNPLTDIKAAGEEVNAAIMGTGKYEGQGAIRRGTAAAATAAMAIPTVVADVIPGGKNALEMIGKGFEGAINTAGNIHNILADAAQKVGVMSPEQRKLYDKRNTDFVNSPEGVAIESVASVAKNVGDVANTILMAAGTARGVQNFVDKKIPVVKQTLATKPPESPSVTASREAQQARFVFDQANEIAAVEARYAKGRKANLYSKDAGADSRQRIAQSNVLKYSVNEDGLIQTKQPGGAVEQYKAVTVKPAEGVVRANLVREGGKTNLSEVRTRLAAEVRASGLEGADLVNALNGIQKEIAGLRLKADPLGYVDNTLLHDAKINTTNNIDFFTPRETATYRKAIARGYKTIVEENTHSFDVKAINAELAKYYEDIARLERLDGMRVTGGRLGKYAAQISGNIVGGAFGSLLGAPGAAVGAILGGEVSGLIKGKSMASTFKDTGGVAPRNLVLDQAVAQGKSPRLALPAGSGVRSTIYSTKTINLPSKSPSTIDAQSKSLGNRNTTYQAPKASSKNSIPNPTTPKPVSKELSPLLSEARKYKTAEEFVKAQGEQVFRGGNEIFDVQKIGQDGVFVTPSQFMAETFGKNVSELYISPNAKVLSYSDLPAKLKDLSWDDAAKQISEYARKNGYDVVDTLPPNIDYPRGMERHVVNPNVLTTKSQLTDIWKKAHNK